MSVQLWDRDQPAVVSVLIPFSPPRALCVLSVEPPSVCMVDHLWRPADPLEFAANPGAQKSLGREQSHLRVVSDRACRPIAGDHTGNAALSVAAADLLDWEEFDRCAQSIARRAGEQTPPEA